MSQSRPHGFDRGERIAREVAERTLEVREERRSELARLAAKTQRDNDMALIKAEYQRQCDYRARMAEERNQRRFDE